MKRQTAKCAGEQVPLPSDYAPLLLHFCFIFERGRSELSLILVISVLVALGKKTPSVLMRLMILEYSHGTWDSCTGYCGHNYTCCVGVYKPFKRNTFLASSTVSTHAERRPDNNNICFVEHKKGGKCAADYSNSCTICFAWTNLSRMIDFTCFFFPSFNIRTFIRYIRSWTEPHILQSVRFSMKFLFFPSICECRAICQVRWALNNCVYRFRNIAYLRSEPTQYWINQKIII